MLLSKSRRRLNELEPHDEFVFHGSGLRISKLEPRQAKTVVDGVPTDDGDPAIYASSLDFDRPISIIKLHGC